MMDAGDGVRAPMDLPPQVWRRLEEGQLFRQLAGWCHDQRSHTALVGDIDRVIVEQRWSSANPAAKRFIEHVARAGAFLAAGIRALGDLQGREAGDSVKTEMARLAKWLDDRARRTGVRVVWQWPETDIRLVAARRVALIAYHLVDNAITAAASSRSRVVACRVGLDSRGVLLAVTDDGPGVDAAIEPVMWDLGTSGWKGMTGIGLYLVRRGVDELSGHVECVRDISTTTFVVSAPIDIR